MRPAQERGKTTEKSPPDPHPITRCDAESAQADSPHARGPSTNLSGLSGLRSEFHAHHELQKTVCARQKEMQASAINGEWLLDGAFKASHESILLEVGLFRAVKTYAALACSSSHCFSTAFDMPAFSKLNVSPYLRRAVAMRTNFAAT